MFDLKRKLVAVAIGCFIATGAFAQKREQRPIKEPNSVVVAPKTPKGERPPPSNNNQGGGGGSDKKPRDKKGRG